MRWKVLESPGIWYVKMGMNPVNGGLKCETLSAYTNYNAQICFLGGDFGGGHLRKGADSRSLNEELVSAEDTEMGRCWSQLTCITHDTVEWHYKWNITVHLADENTRKYDDLPHILTQGQTASWLI